VPSSFIIDMPTTALSAVISLPSATAAFATELPSAAGLAFSLLAMLKPFATAKDEQRLKRAMELLAIHS